MARETVARETFASAATSAIVARRRSFDRAKMTNSLRDEVEHWEALGGTADVGIGTTVQVRTVLRRPPT
jgi:hypothetical protein